MAQQHMTRISFLDGQVLHDFHLNRMQSNIAEGLKNKTTKERYDLLLLVSPYNYYFMEPFTTDENRHEDSTADRDTLTHSITSDAWVTKMLELPETTNEICIMSEFEDYPNRNADVEFYYRSSTATSWVRINADEPVYVPDTKYIQLKVNCFYDGDIRPRVHDFALMHK